MLSSREEELVERQRRAIMRIVGEPDTSSDLDAATPSPDIDRPTLGGMPDRLIAEGEAGAAGAAILMIINAKRTIRMLEPQLEEARRLLWSGLLQAREAGVRVADLADLAGVSHARVYALLEEARKREATEAARTAAVRTASEPGGSVPAETTLAPAEDLSIHAKMQSVESARRSSSRRGKRP
jgi:hypothetical protein